MPNILLTNYYSKAPLDIIVKLVTADYRIISPDRPGKEAIIEKADSADYLLVGGRVPIDIDIIDKAPNLKMIQRTGVGTDTIDLNLLHKKGIPVYVNRGVNSRSVAEHTLVLILAVLRNLTTIDSGMKGGKWQKHELGVRCNELYAKTVGLAGIGHIGREVAKMLNAFGTKVLYHEPFRLNREEEKDLNVTYCSFRELLQESDILSLHCPLNSKTEMMIGSTEIAAMKPGSIIINTARGKLIDEVALVNALASGHLRGAGLDVYFEEPLPGDSKLTKLSNVILTPHIGGITAETFSRMMSSALENIQHFEEGNLAILEDKRLKI